MKGKIIGLRLRKLRGDRSIATIANQIGISKSALAMYERGERIPRDEIKIKIAKYYGVSVLDIFFT